jgi:hypothetical protein
MRLSLVSTALLLALLPAPLPAQQPPAARPPACTSSEHRQFDFWIGDWDVTLPNGKHAGTNTIRPILGGCVLQENWTGAGGLTGTSYNIYDRNSRRWHQTWVDDQGSLLELNGGFADGRMVLSGEQEAEDSMGVSIQRITWTPTGSDQVRQLWESSTDGGKTWTVQFDGRYRRKG